MAPGIPVVDLFADAPVGNPKPSAYLLAACAVWLRRKLSFSALWIPASAGCARPLFSRPTAGGMSAPATACSSWSSAVPERRGNGTSTGTPIGQLPRAISSHPSRPCYRGEPPPGRPRNDDADRREDWPDDLSEIVYLDHFGNAMTGLRAAQLPRNARLTAAGRVLERAKTFSDRQPGTALWYENSNGLAEIAVNQGRADRELGLSISAQVEIVA